MEKQDDILESYNKTYQTMLNIPEKTLGKFKGNKEDYGMILNYLKMKYGRNNLKIKIAPDQNFLLFQSNFPIKLKK